MIASQRKLHALIIRSSLAVSKYWLHIRNRLQRLPVFSPGDTCNNPRLTGCHGKYQEHKNSAQSSGKIPCGQCYQTGRLQCRPCRSDPYPAVLYGVFADGVLISRKPDTLASKIGRYLLIYLSKLDVDSPNRFVYTIFIIKKG